MEFLVFLEGIRTPFLDRFFSLVTILGEETLFTVAALVLFWCVDQKKGYFLLYVGLFGTVINQFLKMLCCVPRPWLKDPNFTIVESAREAATGYSFPSGHTQSIAGMGFSVFSFVKKYWQKAMALLIVLLVAFSRMYLGVHTPADVGVSLLIGAALAFGLYPLFEKHADDPNFLPRAIAVLVGVSALFVLYAEFAPLPKNAIAEFSAHGAKQAYTMFGSTVGLLTVCLIHKKAGGFSEKAVWWVQILKIIVGFGLVMLVRTGTKEALLALFHGHNIANAVRYFLMFLIGGALYPLTFRFLPAALQGKVCAK